MSTIVPRWEWRTFARTLDTAIDLSSYRTVRQAESSEIYLAGPDSAANPKVRDQLIDIKVLQRAEDNLELWMPILKAPFPLSAPRVKSVFEALGVVGPQPESPWDLETLLQAIERDSNTWAVAVRKARAQYDVDGCIVERSQLWFDEQPFVTVAAESPDPRLVSGTVAKLGLQELGNTSYGKALQRLKAGTLG